MGHANIAKYCNRPEIRPGDLDSLGQWRSTEIKDKRAEQMNSRLIAKWNSRVKPEDTTYILGDFCCFGNDRGVSGSRTKAREWLEQLNGTKIIILGNHDSNNGCDRGLDWALLSAGNKRIILIHNPAHVDPVVAHTLKLDAVLCGHVHTAWHVKELVTQSELMTASGPVRCTERTIPMVNMGVDMNKYAPVTLSEALGLITKWEREYNKGKP